MPFEGGHLLANLLRFAALLRGLGIRVTTQQVAELGQALNLIGIEEREDLRAASSAIFVRRQADIAPFEMAFDQFFRDPDTRPRKSGLPHHYQTDRPPAAGSAETPVAPSAAEAEQSVEAPGEGSEGEPVLFGVEAEGAADEEGTETVERASYSPTPAFGRKDFGTMSEAELDAVKRFLRDHRFAFQGRVTRRLRQAARGPRLDMRKMLKGEALSRWHPPALRFREKKQKPRPIVVLCDVSGSMEPYARVLLAFVYALAHEARRVEAFAFSTRLTRITRALKEREIDAALHHAATTIHDYAGGTRIGAALKAFNYEWARRVLGQGPIVLIISDGWDRGDTALLAREMERLHLSCHALIWLNPLGGMPGYEPLTKGLLAALPFVDHFLPIYNLDSLEKLAHLLSVLDSPLPLRRAGRLRAVA